MRLVAERWKVEKAKRASALTSQTLGDEISGVLRSLAVIDLD